MGPTKKRKHIALIALAIVILSPLLFFAFRKARTHYIISNYYKEARWHELKKQHASYKKKGPAFILLGNSITENFKHHLPESDSIINMGISGDFTEGLIRRIDNVTNFKPDQLFIMIGINDIVERVPLKDIQNNYIKIIDHVRAKTPHTTICVQSTLPTRHLKSPLRSSKDINKVVMELNSFLKEKTSERNIVFVDMYSDFADENNELKEELTYDGVHLTEEGYDIWKSYLEKHVSLEKTEL